MKGISRRFISIIWVASLMVAMCLLYSCAKMTVIESEQIGVGTLSLSVTVAGDTASFENKLANNAPLRTIAPEQLTGNLAGHTLTLSAWNNRQSLPDQTITLTANGKTTITGIPYGNWQLKLVAKDAAGDSVLQASSGVTVDYIDPVSVEFVLKPVEGGSGNVEVRFTLDTTDFNSLGAGTVQIGLYDPLNYGLVANSLQSPTLTRNLTYNPQNIPAGEYVLRLTITAGTGGSLKQGARVTWSDRIFVEATRTSGATITLTQMFQKPNTPTNPNFTNNGATATGATEVSLTWGHVYNASAYELEVLEYTGTQTVTATNWATVAQSAGSEVVTYNAEPNDQNNYLAHNSRLESQYYIDGGLLPCQNTISLGLRLGTKSYAARIRATNFYGNSEWLYFTTPTTNPIPTIAPPAAPTGFDFTAGYYASNTQSFNTRFTWTDVATNEDGYELQFLEIGRTTPTPRTDADWNNLANSTNVTIYKGSSVGSGGGIPCGYEGGSLLANSGSVYLSVKRHTSNYYAVRLSAYNAGGNSTWVYPPAQKLLLPPPLFTVTTTGSYLNTNNNLQVYDATLTLQDIAGNGFTYVYEWIALRSGDLTPLFTATNQAAKDAAWKTLRDIPQNNTNPYLSGDNKEISSLQIRVPMLNANTPFPFRVRTVVKSGGQVVEATPWYYHLKKIINQ